MTSTPSGIPGESLELERTGSLLICRFAESHRVLSWAIVGGGMRQASAVACCQVDGSDLRPPVDAAALLRERLNAAGLESAVGLLTSRRLDAYVDVADSQGRLSARCIATVGLSNALRCGDAPSDAPLAGTINLLCRLSFPLTDEGMVEALAMAAEAKTIATLAAAVPSRASGRLASGTGTDCIVIAAPVEGEPLSYVGKHTSPGSLIGHVVEQAVRDGIHAWKQERQTPPGDYLRRR